MNANLTIVVYHDISDGASKLVRSLHVSTAAENFKTHVEYFSRCYDVISATDLLRGELPKRPLLLTFDDAYRSVLEVAAPILRQANLPSLFFLNSGPITSGVVPFDNLLAFAVEELGLSEVLKLFGKTRLELTSVGQLISAIVPYMREGQIDVIREKICAALQVNEIELAKNSRLLLKPDEVAQLVRYGIEIGNHSMNHRFFRSLPEDQLRREIAGGQEALQHLSGQSIKCLSIPYGNSMDATMVAREIAAKTGHEILFLAGARSNRFTKTRDLLDRVSLTNQSVFALPLKLQVYPLLRALSG